MENDLAALRIRLAAIVEHSQDAILAKDLHGVVTAWNPAAERLYGFRADEMVGQPIETIVPPELLGETQYILSEVLEGRAVAPYDTERLTKDGRRVPVSIAVSPLRDGGGAVVGASTIARDISDRLTAEADRVWTQRLIEQSADAIIALDADARITTWNPAAEQLFGYSAQEAIGRLGTDVVAAAEPDEQVAISSSVIGAGATRRYEAKRRHRDGSELVVQVSIGPLTGHDGTPKGAVVSVRDVTEARAAQEQIAATQQREADLARELEQTRRLESVGQLAGGIAHDFNNLLGVILNLAVFVAEELPEGSQGREDAQEIELAARRAATLTRQLLIFSRRDQIHTEVFDPGKLVRELGSFLTRAIGETAQMFVSADTDLWCVDMDRGQLEQIVVNLAVNARDAMPAGGKLVIETRNTVVDEEFARSRVGLDPGDYVTLTVSDTGTGMEQDVIDHVFEPFFTTKPQGHGTGLGLATVYGIVNKAGGRVAIYSEPGRGTSVHVHLPAVRHTAAATIAPAPPAAPGTGERILVVEDAADVRSITERILKRAGYLVTAASTASDALELLTIDAPPYDLIVTDVVMPGVTGPELIDEIRGADPTMRALFMSGYSHQMLTDEILDHPRTAFIEKPFTANDLRTRIRELLDRGD